MKILKEKKPLENWSEVVICTGGSWNQNGKVPCGSSLEINADDLLARNWSKYPNYSGTDYGVICPVCHCFTELKEDKLTNELKNIAKDYGAVMPNVN